MNVKNKLMGYFPAFGHKNFRLFWCGQLVSLIGTWMQNTALSWLVYDITGNRFYVGLMNAVQFTPVLLFTLYAGVIIEKYPKRKLIILTQALQAVGAFALFLLMFTHSMKFGYILIIMFCIGIAQSLDNPARQSFVVEMVEGRDHLINAIALNSAVFNGARLIGPAIAGIVLAKLGPTWCFLLNAVSFIAVLIGLIMMSMDDKPVRSEVKNPGKDILEGFKYIAKSPKLLYTFIATAIIPTFCMNFNTLVPIFTKDVLRLDAREFGILLSSLGFGALISAVSVAAKGKKEGAVRKQLIGSFGLSVALIAAGLVPKFYMAIIVFAVCGFFMITFNTTCNTVLQLNSPDNMRGRIMSVYSFVFGGLAPVGSLYAGTAAKYLGSQYAFIISGIIGFGAFLLLLKKRKELS
jgi:MFS family permease